MKTRGLVAALLLSAGGAAADVDWARGHVTGTGLGVADRHAPSPAAAREPARRGAEDAAKKRLAAQLPDLPIAGGSTLRAKLADKQVAARIARAVDAAVTVTATPHTDGSWHVTLAVPIEAVRLALAGPRAATTSDLDPPVIVVEGATAKPAVGYSIGGVAAATLFVKDVPAWAKDAPRVKAGAASAKDIALSTKQGGASTLFVVITK